jgi:hypothetical protein
MVQASRDASARKTKATPLPIGRKGDARPPVGSRENAEIDRLWTGVSAENRPVFEYYDYFFTGEDVKLFIEGVEPPDSDASLPVIEFAFKMTQQKSPVYGFWSYTYDSVLRGSRVVNGVMRIATTSTNYMTRILSKAADSRARGETDHILRGLDLDESNINEYWRRHIEPDRIQEKNIFSVHPPFNFVVVYGIDSMSACLPPNPKVDGFVIDKYDSGFGMMSNDDNHKLLEIDQENNTMRRVIESVEIVDMQVEYSPNGQVCSELYSFIARDSYSPVPLEGPRQVKGDNVFVPDASGRPRISGGLTQ